ncbi:MAG: class I SAM-dependent methyltransferase [Myxococcaceae bacterium]
MKRDTLGTQVVELFDEKAPSWGEKYDVSGSLRDRLLRFVVALRERKPPPANIFELGCGTGDLAGALNAQGYAVTAADVSQRMLDQAKVRFGHEKIRWHELPTGWRSLPLATASVDAVLASSVLEYVPDVPVVLAECARVLAPGGVFLATVPNPAHWIRKVEGLFSVDWVGTAMGPLTARVPKLRNYRRYLEVSRNRWPPEQWQLLLREAGLSPEPQLESRGPLTLLGAVRGRTSVGST